MFFIPTNKFIKWSVSKKLTIVEIGAGTAPISQMLQDRGISCIPIDLFPENHQIILADAQKYEYFPEHFPIIARPCRGEWIQNTAQKALTESGKCLYIINTPNEV